MCSSQNTIRGEDSCPYTLLSGTCENQRLFMPAEASSCNHEFIVFSSSVNPAGLRLNPGQPGECVQGFANSAAEQGPLCHSDFLICVGRGAPT